MQNYVLKKIVMGYLACYSSWFDPIFLIKILEILLPLQTSFELWFSDDCETALNKFISMNKCFYYAAIDLAISRSNFKIL